MKKKVVGTSWRSVSRLFALTFYLTLWLGSSLVPLAQFDGESPESSSEIPDRADWLFDQRAYPLGYIPMNARLNALNQLDALTQNQSLALAPVQGNLWTGLGPAPVGINQPWSGRVDTIAADPGNANHWLIGAASGGIWETFDNGSTWVPKTDAQKSLAMGAIAFAPSNPNIVYAGTGDAVFACSYFGAGLLKSTDGSNSWTLLATSTFANTSFNKIKVHPSDANTLLATTINFSYAGRGCDSAPSVPPSGLFKSTDGGNNWTLKLPGEATDLEIDPTNFNRQYAGIGDPTGSSLNGVYRSTDAGETWVPIIGPWTTAFGGVGVVKLALAPSNPNVIYVSIQDANNGVGTDSGLLGLWRTSNAFDPIPLWTQVPTGSTDNNTGVYGYCGWNFGFNTAQPNCAYDHYVIVDPTDPNTLYAGGISLWQCSACNAKFPAWSEVSRIRSSNGIHADQQTATWRGNRLIVGNDGGVWSTTDAGVTWINHNTNLSITQLFAGALHPTDPNFALAGGVDNGTEKFTGTSTWPLVFEADGADVAISSTKPNTDWAVVIQYLRVFRTKNGGGGFSEADDGIDRTGARIISPVQKCPTDDNVFIAGNKSVWRINSFFSALSPVWFSDSPNPLDSTASPTRQFITALAFAPSDPTCSTYVAASAAGKIFLTTNGGTSWSGDISAGVPDRYVTDLAFAPTNANILYATLSGFDEGTPGTPGHLFKTVNALAVSPNWTNISPNVNIPFNTLVIDAVNPSLIHIGTDVGILKTNDGGNTWSVLATNSGLPNVAVFDLEVNNATGTLMAFTHGRGVFRVQSQSVPPPGTPALVHLARDTGNFYSDGSFNSGRSAGGAFNAGFGADVAEWVQVSESLGPGDVVELDIKHPGKYHKASSSYSKMVSGVVSSQPGMTLANPPGTWVKNKSKTQALLVLMGRAMVKASSENGPIHPGDLLVSSSRPGYAMRCSDLRLCEGAIIGKALGALNEHQKEGFILALVTAH
ncbi:hypothetical protein HYR54_05800 [Candidatus Acetothermia bacterium]|nr:hypothetical protein [Candidatus Acetothermia bacterium]